jgi:hypothetical protein
MNVGELIEELRKLPPHMPVRVPAVIVDAGCEACGDESYLRTEGDATVDGVRHNGNHALIETTT